MTISKCVTTITQKYRLLSKGLKPGDLVEFDGKHIVEMMEVASLKPAVVITMQVFHRFPKNSVIE